jgi:myo-inositol-1(or 4)-monophosphatase
MATKSKKTQTHAKTSASRQSQRAKVKPAKKAGARKSPPAKPASSSKRIKPVAKKAAAKPARKAPPKKVVVKKAPVLKPKPSLPAKKPTPKLPEKVPAARPKPQTPPPVAATPPRPVAPPPPPRPKTKMLSREFLIDLGNAIRTAIAPMTHEVRGREVVGSATSGDATFEIDRVAERALLAFLKNVRAPIAYYSEDSGYTTFTNTQPQNLLIVDPIDGTRAAKSGFEACVISIASTRIIERPCMADVDNACVMEIVGDRVFYAERGKGARITQGEHVRRPKLSKNANLEMMAWTMTVPGRPADLIFPTAAKLVDLSSLKGGFFACNSTSFSLTRLLTNQLDACLDFANRFYRDIQNLVRDHFINAGRGTVVGLAPYDLAASLLIAQEAGCIVTDAYGAKLDDVLLLDTTAENHRSIIAAANPELHTKLLKYVDTRVQQLEALLKRRAERAAALAAAQAGR